MTFNWLYNAFLESLIYQNKASRAQMLADIEGHQKIQKFLNQLALKGKTQAKSGDFLAKFFKSGEITDINDKNIQKIVDILSRNTNFNIQTNIKLEDFLKQNQKYLTRELANKTDDLIAYIDKNISEFTEKKVYDNGVVIYRVEQSRAGQAAVRKIIDMQWSQRANPWCLASRDGGGLQSNYKTFWRDKYTAFPKHIAFQNSKLLAFCADSFGNCTWWDRNDHSSTTLKLLDGTTMQTQKYKWTDKQEKELWAIKNDLTFNKETKLWDSNSNVRVRERDCENGHFPVKFGVINGDFDCSYCKNLTSLQGAPTKVTGNIYYTGCVNIPGYKQYILSSFIKNYNLVYNEKTGRYDSQQTVNIDDIYLVDGHFLVKFGVIKGSFSCSYTNIQTLQNGPTYVGGDFKCQYTNLKTLKGAPKEVGKNFKCFNNEYLKTLDIPQTHIKGDFECGRCDKLTTTKNGPRVDGIKDFSRCSKLSYEERKSLIFNKETGRWDCEGNFKIKDEDIVKGQLKYKLGKIKGSFITYRNSLKTLQNGPTWVDGNCEIYNCNQLTSLQGVPKYVGEDFSCTYCQNLTTLQGAPKVVGKSFKCYSNNKLISLQGAPEEINGNFECRECNKLTNLIGAPKKVSGTFDCSFCRNLISLEGAPEYVGREFDCHSCEKLRSFEHKPKVIKGGFDCTECTKAVGYYETLREELIKRLKLKLNPETNRWDCNGNVTLGYYDIFKGKFPVKFGKIKGSFSCTEYSLKSLQGCPTYIGKNFNIKDTSISSLNEVPEYIGGNIKLNKKYDLSKYNVSENFKQGVFKGWAASKRLHYNEETKEWDFAGETLNIYGEDLVDGHIPVKLGGKWKSNLAIQKIEFFFTRDELTSLQGCPDTVGTIICSRCNGLKNLVGGPKDVDYFYCHNCANLESLQGAPERVHRILKCSSCPNLKDISAAPAGCHIDCRRCKNLKLTDEDKQKYVFTDW